MSGKFLRAAALLLAPVVFSGCAAEKPEPIESDFSADFTAYYKSVRYCGSLSRTSVGGLSVTISEPESLDGLSVRYYGSQVTAGPGGLACSADEAYLPSSSLPAVIKSVLDASQSEACILAETQDGTERYSVSVGESGCTITASDGLIASAEIPDSDFKIVFQYASKSD